jgi:hypothetical protein
MIHYLRRSRKHICQFVTLLALVILPVPLSAAWMGYRNDTNGPVVIQAMAIVNNIPVRGQVHILQPGEIAYDRVIILGNKWIVIADAKQPTRTLYQGAVPFTGNDLFFSVQSEAPPANQPKVQRQFLQKVKLTPAKAPTMAPAPPAKVPPKQPRP